MKVLCVIDMQKDFIDGALGTAEAQKIVEPLAKFIEENRDEYYIVATRDTHGENYMETNEGRHLPVPHCIKGTEGWQINPLIAKAIGNAPIYDKPNFGISAEEWKKFLYPADVTEIVLTGLCTDICVVSNALALKTAYPEIPVKVMKDLCAGVSPASHEAALTTMGMCQVEII